MSKQKCQLCGKERETSWPGAAWCQNCGFICSECAKGRDRQCPRCEKRDLREA
jgi:hypothetical protein